MARTRRGTSRRGFAAMDPEKQRQIASKGGKAAHEEGTAHEFDSNEAAKAGRKGGLAVSKDRSHMAEIGRQGGLARGQSLRKGSRSVTRNKQRSGGAGSRQGQSQGRARARSR